MKTIEINKIKSEEQKKAREALRENNGGGIIAMCTGGGKTKIGIDEVADCDSKDGKILWIVPFEKLRDKTIEEEFLKWAPNVEMPDIICYASMKNIMDEDYQLVILDEGHHMTEERANFFYQNEVRRIIALTATPPHEEEKKQIFNNLQLKVVYELSLDEGVAKGVVSPYHIVIHTVPMYKGENKTIKINTGKSSYVVSEEYAYENISKKIDNIFRSGRNVPKFLYIQRAQLIYNFASKTHYAENLLNALSLYSDKRRLVFCGSIKQAEYLCDYTYHSKTNDVDFNKFCEGEINELGVVNAVNEGQNFQGLDEAVIVQLNSNPRHIIQRIGRLVRYRPGHTATIHILVSEGTKDETWAQKALENINSSNISYYTN